jgi:hypothetical protein
MVVLGELKGIRELMIGNMPELVDISNIEGLKSCLVKVDINHCPKLTDISPLLGISIAFCSSVLDTTTLGNHKNFEFYNSKYICSNIDHLTGVDNLTLHCKSIQCDFTTLQIFQEHYHYHHVVHQMMNLFHFLYHYFMVLNYIYYVLVFLI